MSLFFPRNNVCLSRIIVSRDTNREMIMPYESLWNHCAVWWWRAYVHRNSAGNTASINYSYQNSIKRCNTSPRHTKCHHRRNRLSVFAMIRRDETLPHSRFAHSAAWTKQRSIRTIDGSLILIPRASASSPIFRHVIT